MTADDQGVIFRVWWASWIFDFFNFFFFSKYSAQSYGSGNPIEYFHPFGVDLKTGRKSKKLSESTKSDTKLEKHEFKMSYDRKCFTNTYPLIRGFWKSCANLSFGLLIFDTGPICTRKKPGIDQKFIIVFIENWKEIGH